MERDTLVAGLTPQRRQMLRTFEQHGPMAAARLRDPLPLAGDVGWRGRPDSGSRQSDIDALQARGLLYQTGKKGRSRIYAVTPEDRIEAEARRFAQRKPKARRRSKDPDGLAARVHEYRRMEKRAGQYSARGAWIKARRQVVELGRLIRDIDPMLYWSEKTVPPGELEQVYDEMVLVAAYLAESLKYVEANRTVAKKRLTINALLRKAESTEAQFPGEARVYREKARELQDGLDEAA